MVDNVCVNFYHCPDCSNNMAAHEHCAIQGGQLVGHVLNNVTISSQENILGKNTELSQFWGMFAHMDDIIPLPKYTFKSYLNVIKRNLQRNIAVNGSDLCTVFNKSTHCIASDIVLSLKYDYISLEKVVYQTANDVYYVVRKSNTNIYVPPWSVIYQPTFKMANDRQFTLCENSRTHTVMLTNRSDLFMSCHDGTCVHDSLVCDGQPHCQQGEDEDDCQHIYSDHEHSCMSRCHH